MAIEKIIMAIVATISGFAGSFVLLTLSTSRTSTENNLEALQLEKTGRKAVVSSHFIVLGFWENNFYSSYAPNHTQFFIAPAYLSLRAAM